MTDANVVLGRIPEGATFGSLRLDRAAAQAALDRADVTAEGVVRVVDANMERALRAVSVERGVDPGGLALVAFGGAGALHACSLAEAMGMPAVIVPARAGVLSAVGLLTAPPRREVVRSRARPGDLSTLEDDLDRVRRAASALFRPTRGDESATVMTSMDCRYAGQSHELTVGHVEGFHEEHRLRNGYARPDAPVEVVAVRAALTRPPALTLDDLPVPAHRSGATTVTGPRVIAEPDCTIWLAEGWRATPGPAGALVLERT